jgi:hypothetical protein
MMIKIFFTAQATGTDLGPMFYNFSCRNLRIGAYPRVEHVKGASLGWALTLHANIRLGWKAYKGQTLAHYENP